MREHKEIVRQSIENSQMRENLTRAMHTLQKNRANVIKSKFSDWEGLRERAKKAKNDALQNLGELLCEFEKNATKNGFIVHWASTKEQACEIIYELAAKHSVGKILKGKSMASEEIGLNHYLQARGVEAVETDLGELIIQLNNEPPVHIVVPAVHKNRHEVAEIFSTHLGAERPKSTQNIDPSDTSEIQRLNQIAKNHLRAQFEGLQMGLSGVNFALAKEGAIWLIENEGNGRMSTTAPDIHIALCGIEKVMESFEDAATMVALLTPSATGQFIPTYNNIIRGPRRDGELDGPREVHIVLFDNNRSEMLAHSDFNEALRCIRCGTCMNFCPVYDKIGGHAYGTTYPGPIGEVISPNLFGMEKTGDVLSFCSLCGRCAEVCPVKIPLDSLIRKLRSHKIGQGNNAQCEVDSISSLTNSHNNLKSQSTHFGENFIMKSFSNAATNGIKWRKAIKNAARFNGFLSSFGGILPVAKSWNKYKDLPQIKGDLHEVCAKMEGVKYE